MRWRRLALCKVAIAAQFSQKKTGVVCSGNEAEKMCLKPHAVVTVTERKVLPTSSHAQRSFLIYEVRENATLMKHLSESGVHREDSRRQPWKNWNDVSFRHFGVMSVCVWVHDYMRQHVRVFASIFYMSVGMLLLRGNESSLTFPHDAYLQLSSTRKKPCMCNMKNKSLYRVHHEVWEVTVSSDGNSSETWTKERSSPHNTGSAE